MTPEQEIIKNVYRKNKRAFRDSWAANARKHLAPIHWTINERHEWRAAFDHFAEDGKVAIVRAGHDCDCVQYHEVNIDPVPISIVKWLQAEWKHREYLDGPESVWLEKPSRYPKGGGRVSRDRGSEAHEDGHPHVAYMSSLAGEL